MPQREIKRRERGKLVKGETRKKAERGEGSPRLPPAAPGSTLSFPSIYSPAERLLDWMEKD